MYRRCYHRFRGISAGISAGGRLQGSGGTTMASETVTGVPQRPAEGPGPRGTARWTSRTGRGGDRSARAESAAPDSGADAPGGIAPMDAADASVSATSTAADGAGGAGGVDGAEGTEGTGSSGP